VAFVFGLRPRLRFASVLTELGLPRDALVLALVGFNLGVEAGQLAGSSRPSLPLAYFFAPRLVLPPRWSWFGGSVAIVAVALVWLLERVFDMN